MLGYQTWTRKEDEFLFKYANRGPAWCTRKLNKVFGTNRKKGAVQRHGYRIGVSFAAFPALECPECHREFSQLVKVTGMCRECTAVQARERQRERKRRIQENDKRDNSEHVERIRKEAAADRKWASVNK